jgi:ankyrin repeat protein
LIDKQASALK